MVRRPDADPGVLNLAAPVADGTRIYVPVVGEEVPPTPPLPVAVAPGATAPPGPIDLNRATAGRARRPAGHRPVDGRRPSSTTARANGPFASVDDLEAVRGIGPAKLEAIRALVTV